MQFYRVELIDVMSRLRAYLCDHPRNQNANKLQTIMDTYTDHPEYFKRMHIYIKGGISKTITQQAWRLGNGAIFIFSDHDDDVLPEEVFFKGAWLDAYKSMMIENPYLRLTPLWVTKTIRDFVDMVYQECL